jgi:hypothetical protein
MLCMYKQDDNHLLTVVVTAVVFKQEIIFHHVLTIVKKVDEQVLFSINFRWNLAQHYFYDENYDSVLFNKLIVKEICTFHKEINYKCISYDIANNISLNDLFLLYLVALDVVKKKLTKSLCRDCSGFGMCPFKSKTSSDFQCLFFRKKVQKK